jgi:glucosamine-6-phosphate deaminase
MEISGLSIVILDTADAVVTRAMVELEALAKRRPDALVSLAAGETFEPFMDALAFEEQSSSFAMSALRYTYHHEFRDYEPTDSGGLAHELLGCSAIAKAHAEGRFIVVPSGGSDGLLREHEEHLAAVGGVQMQFLGIGSNGKIACCEPGTPFDLGFHRASMVEMTREHIQSRFPDGSETPTEVITAGPSTILSAERVVLMATGASKAAAVRDMMDGGVESTCPASLLRRHPDAVVLLDSSAAADLEWPGI